MARLRLIFWFRLGILKQPSSSSQLSAERSIISALMNVSSIPLSSHQNKFSCLLLQDFQKLFYYPPQKALSDTRSGVQLIRSHLHFSSFPTYRKSVYPVWDKGFRCRCIFVLKYCVSICQNRSFHSRDFLTKFRRISRTGNEPGLNNLSAYPAQALWRNAFVGGHIFKRNVLYNLRLFFK